MRNAPTVLLLIDGLGADMVSSDATPFFHSLVAEDRSGRVKPVLGYSDAQRAALFTGHWPDELDYWFDMEYQPERSPFKPLRHIGWIDRVHWDFGQRAFRFGLSTLLSPLLARRSVHEHVNLFNLPLSLAHNFSPTADGLLDSTTRFQHHPTVFERITAQGGWTSQVLTQTLARRKVFARVPHYRSVLMEGLQSDGDLADLTYIYIHSLDMTAHRVGIEDQRFALELTAIDSLVSEIVDALKRQSPEVQILITADHGMTQTHTFVDYSDLARAAAREKSFLVALDSTMVRLWYHDLAVRDSVRKQVTDGCPGHFMDADELSSMHVKFPHDRFGQDIYLIEPGYSIFPNYHSLLRPLAMHAYSPEHADQAGFIALISNSDTTKIPQSPIEMVDANSIICKLTGIESTTSR